MRSIQRSTLTLTVSLTLIFASLLDASAQTLWYNGDLIGQSATANHVNSSGAGVRVFDDFVVPDSQLWTVQSVWSNDFFAAPFFGPPPRVTRADWSIRTGVSEGNGGQVVASGVNSVSFTQTGRIPNFLYREWKVQVNNLNVTLTPGLYWLNVTPVFGEAYNSVTLGQNAIGIPRGNDDNAFLDAPPNSIFASRGNEDFSMGVAGTAVPEPGSIALLAGIGITSACLAIRMRRRRTSLIVVLLLVSSTQAVLAQGFTVQEIVPPPGSNWSSPVRINQSGQVIGVTYYGDVRKGTRYDRGFVWQNGVIREILPFPGGNSSGANDINNLGQVVGGADGTSGGAALLWVNGISYNLNTVAGPNGVTAQSLGWTLGVSNGINDRGQIVGTGSHYASNGSIDASFFLWERDLSGNVQVTPIFGLYPVDINEDGTVRGDGTGTIAATWKDGVATTYPGINPSYGMNNKGQFVGRDPAYIWLPLTDYGLTAGFNSLGTLGGDRSWAQDVNDIGQVVGWSRNTRGEAHAFLWTSATGMRDLHVLLNSKQWTLESATGINNSPTAAKITGYGWLKGSRRGWVLTPK